MNFEQSLLRMEMMNNRNKNVNFTCLLLKNLGNLLFYFIYLFVFTLKWKYLITVSLVLENSLNSSIQIHDDRLGRKR